MKTASVSARPDHCRHQTSVDYTQTGSGLEKTFAVTRTKAKKMSNWMTVSPVFIVGPARSGTTLLRLMLSAHPEISISSEGAYLFHVRSNFESYGDLSTEINLKALANDLLPYLHGEHFLKPPGFRPLCAWVRKFGPSLRSIITFFGTWEARVLGKTQLAWWGDNAPYHVHDLPFFDSIFPNSKFVAMNRDPRDTYASSKVSLNWHDSERVLSDWEGATLNALLAESRLGPTRVKQVKYEHLVTSPREQLEGICDLLGVKFSSAMLSYNRSSAAKAIAKLSHHRNLLLPVFSSSIGRYKDILSPDELSAIECRLRTPMRYLGYLSSCEFDTISRKIAGARLKDFQVSTRFGTVD